jgi:hypothetical protein
MTEMNSWKNIELKVRSVNKFVKIPPELVNRPLYTHTDSTYIETAAGDRFLETIGVLPDGAKIRRSSYFHNGRAAAVTYDPKDSTVEEHVSISRTFHRENLPGANGRPVPLSYFYVDKVPLYEALPKAEYLGEETGKFGLCDKYLFKDVKIVAALQDRVYYLDRATSLPVQVDALGTSGESKGQSLFSWTATKVETIQGHPFATKSLTTMYKSGEQSKAVLSTISEDVLSLRYDADLSSVAFWPTIDPGVRVSDQIAHETTVTPGKPKVDPVKAATSGTTTPVVAEPPRDWTSVLSYGGIGLGAAVLVAAFLIWRRR